MKAAILTKQGDPTVLSIRDDYPKPQIAKGHEVLIKVKAIAISSADLMTRRGFTAGPVITPPQIIGSECIGVVEAVSPDLERPEERTETRIGRLGAKYRAGDVVIALMGGMGRMFDGCYAEYVALPPICLSAPLLEVARLSMPLTSDSSPAQPSPSYGLLAAIPGAFLVAHGVLIKSLQIRTTDTLLIHGGSSAIGMAIALIAKNVCGLKKIVGTTRSKDKLSKMQAGGFDTVIVLKEPTVPSTAEELSDRIKREGGQLSGFTTIVDLIGATSIPISLLCADRRNGAIVCMAGMLAGAYHFTEPFSPMSIPPRVFLTGYSSSVEEHLLPLSDIVKDVLVGRINPAVDKVFKFKDIAEAHKYCESGVTCGKVVCILD